MKRVIAVWLSFAILFSCLNCLAESGASSGDVTSDIETPDFDSMDETELMQYIEDSINATLEAELQGSDFVIEEVSAIYISQDYLDEVGYNTKENIFFGYSLKELNQLFQGKRYVFTCKDGETIVKEFEEFTDDTYKGLLEIAKGAGIILLNVAITMGTGGGHFIFSVSRKCIGETFIKGVYAAIVYGANNDWDVQEMLDAGLREVDEEIAWSAIWNLFVPEES